MNQSRIDEFLRVAKLAAMSAGNFALKNFTRVHVLHEKKKSFDVFTSVDVESEKRIANILRKNFPSHIIFTEERALPYKTKEYIWWVDPLDGSVSYSFGLPYWGISLALVHNGKPLIGVLYFPQTKHMYWAVAGRGSFRNSEKIHVSKTASLKESVIGIDYGYRGERQEGVKRVTYKIIDQVQYMTTYACTIEAFALVAEGKLSGYVHHAAYRFDLTAGALIVSEAGGQVNDMQGKKIDWTDTDMVNCVATNGKIHTELMKMIRFPAGQA